MYVSDDCELPVQLVSYQCVVHRAKIMPWILQILNTFGIKLYMFMPLRDHSWVSRESYDVTVADECNADAFMRHVKDGLLSVKARDGNGCNGY